MVYVNCYKFKKMILVILDATLCILLCSCGSDGTPETPALDNSTSTIQPTVSKGTNAEPTESDIIPDIKIDKENLPQELLDTLELCEGEYDSATVTDEEVLSRIIHPITGLYHYAMYPGDKFSETFQDLGHPADSVLDKHFYRDGGYYYSVYSPQHIEWIADVILNHPISRPNGLKVFNDTMIFYKGAYYNLHGDGGNISPDEIIVDSVSRTGSDYNIVFTTHYDFMDPSDRTWYAVLRPKQVNGTIYWSIIKASNSNIFDVPASESGSSAQPDSGFTPDAVGMYLDFMQNRKYMEYLDDFWWCDPPSQYVILDIDRDGQEELLVAGENGAGFQNFLLFAYNSEEGIQNIKVVDKDNSGVITSTGVCYGGFEYSSNHHALIYTEMNDPWSSMGYWEIAGDELQKSFRLDCDIEHMNSPMTYSKNWEEISESEYMEYQNEAMPVELKPIP